MFVREKQRISYTCLTNYFPIILPRMQLCYGTFFPHILQYFFLYSTSLCFSFSKRFLYCSRPYCCLLLFSFLKRPGCLSRVFHEAFTLVCFIVFIWWIFRHFYLNIFWIIQYFFFQRLYRYLVILLLTDRGSTFSMFSDVFKMFTNDKQRSMLFNIKLPWNDSFSYPITLRNH